eukprot:m.134777 g.134777  ORF g.134777 m.134777 type:complete len:956 (+) comp9732_c0_seq1:47-2914(+)
MGVCEGCVSVAAIVALLMVTSSLAEEFVFKADECNTLFSNPTNWKGGIPPTIQDYKKLVVGPQGPNQKWSAVSTLLPTHNYKMNEIVLAWDGELVFEADSVFEFSDSLDLAGTAIFVGGQTYKEKCDFHCHKNWLVDGQNATRTPCSEDVAVFPEGYSYKVWIQGFTPIGRLSFAGQNLTSEMNRHRIPSFQTFPPRENLDFFLQDDDGLYGLCEEFGLFQNGSCVCNSFCVDKEEIDMFEEQQRELAAQRAEEQLKLWGSNYTDSFLVVYLPNLILDDARILDVFKTVITPDYIPDLTQRLEAALESIANGGSADFMGVEFDERTSSMILQGSVTASYDFFFDTTTGMKTWESFAVVDTSPSPQQIFSYTMWKTIIDFLDEVYGEECDSSIKRQQQVCDALYGKVCTSVVTLSVALFDPLEIVTNFNALFPDVIAFFDATPSGTYNGSHIVDSLFLKSGITREAALLALGTFTSQVSWARLVYEGYAGSPVEDFVQLHKECESAPEAIMNVQALNTATLQTHSISFHVGRSLPYPDIVDILRQGGDKFANYVCENLHGRSPISQVLCNSVVASLPPTSRRRDASTKNIGILVEFDYTMVVSSDCMTGEIRTDCPVVESDNTIYNRLQDILDSYVVLFSSDVRGKCVVFGEPIDIDSQCAKTSAAYILVDALSVDSTLPASTWSSIVITDFIASVGICGTSCTVTNQVSDPEYEVELVMLKDDVRAYAFAYAAAWLEQNRDTVVSDDFFNDIPIDDDFIVGTTTTVTTTTVTTTTVRGQSTTSAAATTTAAPTTTSTSTSIASTDNTPQQSQASSTLLFMGAAAGGIVIILLIVIVVLLVNRNKNEKNFARKVTRKFQNDPELISSKRDSVTMVPRAALAFENPLYDDADVQETNINAAYDDDGLYDEPAEMNRGARENPIYQSTEYLDAEEINDDEDDEGGYLDVVPDDNENDE